MTLPLIFDEMLPKLLHKAISWILQIIARIVTVITQHCVLCCKQLLSSTMLEFVSYVFEMFYTLVL